MFDNVTNTLKNRFQSITWIGQELVTFLVAAIALKYISEIIGVDPWGLHLNIIQKYVGRNDRGRLTRSGVTGVDRTDLGSEGNQWHSDAKELALNMPVRAVKKDNEHYVNTRALNNNLSVSDRNDTLYKSPNAYEPEISENDIATKLLGRAQ